MNKMHRRVSLAQPLNISIIAHRGNTATVKSENTIEAFQQAMVVLQDCAHDIGINKIEFDLRMSKDGYLISYHDKSIDDINIGDLYYHELRSIAQGKGFDIPLFEDILKLCCDRIALDIELKEEGYEDRIVALTTKYLKYSDFVIKSFNDASVRKIKALDPQIKAGLLLGKVSGKSPLFSIVSQFFPEYRILKTGADFVAPHFRLLKFGFLWRMKALHREVYVWTVNEEWRLFKLLGSKYISAIITDKPELALKILDTLRNER